MIIRPGSTRRDDPPLLGYSDSEDKQSDDVFESEDSEWDDDFADECAFVCFNAASAGLNTREGFYARERLIWSNHVQKLRRENMFDRTYRMNKAHFDRLITLLRQDLFVDGVMSTRRTGSAPISEEVVLLCTLRYLAGGSYLNVRDVAHVSVATFYRCLHRGISAILQCSKLAIRLPSNGTEIDDAAAAFKNESAEGVLDGCVGCVDGMLVKIITPSRKEAGNVRAYFSGHYHHMGLNIQAACDHSYQFIYFAIVAPGGSSDLWEFKKTKLAAFVDQLPPNRYIIGDGAYTPTEHMLTPFGGSGKLNGAHDTYDFYVSQLRIKIEQSFGRLTNKWRCLKSPLSLSLKNTSRAIMATARLHNFCVNLDETFVLAEASETIVIDGTPEADRSFWPSEVRDVNDYSIPGVSDLRERIVSFILNVPLRRPHHNLVRRAALSR